MRRTTVLTAAAAAIVLTLLTGCEGDGGGKAAPAASSSVTASASAPAADAAAFDPERALAGASKEPYAVSVKMTNEVAGTAAVTAKLRQNRNTAEGGRGEIRSTTIGLAQEFVITADATYRREADTPGAPWTRTTTPDVGSPDYAAHARLLLAQGPAARKGMETRDGVPVFHLAGRLDAGQIAGSDPVTHRMFKSSGSGLGIDLWIDAQGRTRYVEQTATTPGGAVMVIKVTLSDFGPPETFAAPITG
ncbi:hypothetical protein ACWEQL_07955 [Kitasatospora sp. NPDC004240]